MLLDLHTTKYRIVAVKRRFRKQLEDDNSYLIIFMFLRFPRQNLLNIGIDNNKKGSYNVFIVNNNSEYDCHCFLPFNALSDSPVLIQWIWFYHENLCRDLICQCCRFLGGGTSHRVD